MDFKSLLAGGCLWLARAVEPKTLCSEGFFDLDSRCSLLIRWPDDGLEELRAFGGDSTWDCHEHILLEDLRNFMGEVVGGIGRAGLSVVGHVWSRECLLLTAKGVHPGVSFAGRVVTYNYPGKWREVPAFCPVTARLRITPAEHELTPGKAARRALDPMRCDGGGPGLAETLGTCDAASIPGALLGCCGNAVDVSPAQVISFAKFLLANAATYTPLGPETTVLTYRKGRDMAHRHAMRRARVVHRRAGDDRYGQARHRLYAVLFMVECAGAINLDSDLDVNAAERLAGNASYITPWVERSVAVFESAEAGNGEAFERCLAAYLRCRETLQTGFATHRGI